MRIQRWKLKHIIITRYLMSDGYARMNFSNRHTGSYDTYFRVFCERTQLFLTEPIRRYFDKLGHYLT